MVGLILAGLLTLEPFVGTWKVRVFGAPVGFRERSYRIELERDLSGQTLFGQTRDETLASLAPLPTRLHGRHWPLVLVTQSNRRAFCHRFVGRVSRRGMKGWVALFETTCEQRRLTRYFRWQARREE